MCLLVCLHIKRINWKQLRFCFYKFLYWVLRMLSLWVLLKPLVEKQSPAFLIKLQAQACKKERLAQVFFLCFSSGGCFWHLQKMYCMPSLMFQIAKFMKIDTKIHTHNITHKENFLYDIRTSFLKYFRVFQSNAI